MIGVFYLPARLNGVGFVVLLCQVFRGHIRYLPLGEAGIDSGPMIKYDTWEAAQSHADSLNQSELDA